jgi:hypothetical protein
LDFLGQVPLKGKPYFGFMETETVQIEGTESQPLMPARSGIERIARLFRLRERESTPARGKAGAPDRKPEEIL